MPGAYVVDTHSIIVQCHVCENMMPSHFEILITQHNMVYHERPTIKYYYREPFISTNLLIKRIFPLSIHLQPINRQKRELPRVMFVEPPVTLIPRSLPQAQSHPYNGSDDVNEYEDGVKFEPPSAMSSSSSFPSTTTSSEGRGSFSSGRQGRPGSLDSGSTEQTDDGGQPARYQPACTCT